MNVIELHERYPLSRREDITDAYMRGVEFGRKMGLGTCKMVVDNRHRVDKVTTSWGCVCSACGGFHEFTHGEGWAFCPSCGREVVNG